MFSTSFAATRMTAYGPVGEPGMIALFVLVQVGVIATGRLGVGELSTGLVLGLGVNVREAIVSTLLVDPPKGLRKGTSARLSLQPRLMTNKRERRIGTIVRFFINHSFE